MNCLHLSLHDYSSKMIGIVGGVGPYAGLDLAKNVFDNTIAATDQDHLPVMMLSHPATILDRTEYLLGQIKINPGKAIAEVILRLEKAGATVAGIPCNTAHEESIFGLTKKVLAEYNSRIHLLNMVDETVAALKAQYPEIKHVGILSTTGTWKFGVYAQPLVAAGFTPVALKAEEQTELVHPAIYDKKYGIKAKSNPVTNKAREDLLAAILQLKEKGAELIIKGCTEIALAIPEKIVEGVHSLDPSIVLARSLIRTINPKKLKIIES